MTARTPESVAMPASLRGLLLNLVALLCLLTLSAALALMPLGIYSTLGSLAIAIAKALLVMTFYMRLKAGNPLLRLAAGIAFAWLFLLIGLSVLELLTREQWTIQ